MPCKFCEIIAGRSAAEVVYEDRRVVAFFPTSPATLGHTLVVPRRHIRDMLDVDAESSVAIAKVVPRIARALQSVVKPEGMNLISSAGGAASQSVFHLHLHLVPRWKNDEMGDIWPQAGAVISGEELGLLKARMVKAIG